MRLTKVQKNKEIKKLLVQLKNVIWDLTLNAMKKNPNNKEDEIGLDMIASVKKQIVKSERNEF